MDDPVYQVTKALSLAMKDGQDSYIEFLQSELHECERNNDTSLIIFQTPDQKLKMMPNKTSVFVLPTSSEIKCCPWCGFQVEVKDA